MKRLLVLALAALLGAACDSSPRTLVRLGSLVQVEKTEPVALPPGSVSLDAPYQLDTNLNAARIAGLRLRARGSATMATVSWKLAGDHGFPPFRTLSFPMAPDGSEHSYAIDLRREPYWTGRVEALRFGVDKGAMDVLELTGDPARGAYRSMSLKGESRPSLPGLGRIEVALPDRLPAGATFEAHLGIVPEYDRPGVRAVFRAWLEQGGRRDLWLEETLDASGGAEGWRLVRRKLPGGGGKLALEVDVRRAGEPLPEGAALWGDPLVVTPGRKQGKNLVVILVDTVRADLVGAYGSRDNITPNIDRLAAQSVRFAEMTSPSPWTLPSVSSLMTGLQPQTHGAGIRYGEFAPTGLTGGVHTLAEVLRDSGVYTFGVYHNIYVNPAFGLEQGFEEYASLEEKAGPLVDRALAGLKQYGSDRRFFLYLHIFDPHNPYEPPEPECREATARFAPGYHGSLGCSVDRRPEMPMPPAEDRQWYAALYRGEILYTDRQIGRFLAGLHDLGLDDDTIVAFVSDHGEELWTRTERENQWGYEANGDHGHTLYQELLHVPALVRIPGHAPAVLEGPVQTVDLFPTLIHLMGIEPPPSQGQDLLPLVTGAKGAKGAPQTRPLLLADVILHGQSRWSVRRGPWKLIVPREPGPPLELYNLEQDPGETHNLAAAQPDVVASLRTLGERELEQRKKDRGRYITGDNALGATYLEWNHITKLRALGYLR
ncbi:MAG TPA: sulfatase [Thermoanaerobaculia bacterium]|nr:sulfatase [Thermoanaerobaculia bacterium]